MLTALAFVLAVHRLPPGFVVAEEAPAPVALRAAASSPPVPEVPGWLAGLVERLCEGYRAGTESTGRVTQEIREVE